MPVTPIVDVLRGMLARSTDGIAGGRHKVFGNHSLSIIPQTSTIASHLPRAVGLALSGEYRAERTDRLARRHGRRVQFRRRIAQPLHRPGRPQLGRPRRASRPARPDPVRVRGQRARPERPDAGRLGPLVARRTPRPHRRDRADGADPVGTWRATVELVDEIRRAGGPASSISRRSAFSATPAPTSSRRTGASPR